MLSLLVFVFASSVGTIYGTPIPDPDACVMAADKTLDIPACNAAIAAETEPRIKAELLYRRADFRNDSDDYVSRQAALADLNAAVALDPGNWHALHERAFTLNDIGDYAGAERDLSAMVKYTPENAGLYQERALSRLLLGNLQGAFEDRDRESQLRPDNEADLAARAYALMWLGRFDEARANLQSAQAMTSKSGNPDAIKASARDMTALTLWTNVSGDAAASKKACNAADASGDYSGPALIGDCTRAFLDANTPRDRAAMLTDRATAWLIGRHDEDNYLTDARIAVRLDPTDPLWRSNLGFAYIRAKHSTAAIDEFNVSIAAKPDFVNYAGRAEAKFNIGDYDGASADALKSIAYKPNEIAYLVLGDLAEEKGDMAAAKQHWLDAYKSGERDDDLKERFEKAGVSWPPPDDSPKVPAPPSP